jgi:hypothetical protein
VRDAPPPDAAVDTRMRREVGGSQSWTPARGALKGHVRDGELVLCERGWYFTSDGLALGTTYEQVVAVRRRGRIRAQADIEVADGTWTVWFADRSDAATVVAALGGHAG